MKKSKHFMEFLLLIATFCWGMTYLWCDDIAQVNMPISGYNAIRYGLTILIAFPFLGKSLKSVDRISLIECVAMGTLYYAISYLQVVAIKYTTPSCMAFLFAAYVVIVPFATRIFFKTKINKKIYISVVFALAGIYLLNMTPGETLTINLGNGLSVLGAFMLCAQILFLSHMVSHMSVGVANMVPWITVLVESSIHALLTGGFNIDVPMLLAMAKPVLLMVIFGTLVSSVVQAYAQKYVEPSKAAIIYSMESVFACAMSIGLGYEPMTKMVLIGGALVLVAILNVEIDWEKKR
ncbi:MAG: DMT family transporter [Clostridia bacterium]|nr:DMT family transporter [Clostridia bacterium]